MSNFKMGVLLLVTNIALGVYGGLSWWTVAGCAAGAYLIGEGEL